MSLIFSWDNLQKITSLDGTGGILRQKNNDFIVKEIPIYLPSGNGEHLYILIEKDGQNTNFIISEISKQLRIPKKFIGVAGQKDRHAITTQWLSIPAKYERKLQFLQIDNFKILKTNLHNNKLKIGHLKGNQFIIRVQDPNNFDKNLIQNKINQLKNGIPNYFGEQRFGLEGKNSLEALNIINNKSEIKDIYLKSFLISALQSTIFNAVLSKRIELNIFDKVLKGDWAKKIDTGGIFLSENDEIKRSLAKEISPLITLYGRKVSLPKFKPLKIEMEVLQSFNLDKEMFNSLHGDQRSTRIFFLNEPKVIFEENSYILDFALPKGGFASSVLREIIK